MKSIAEACRAVLLTAEPRDKVKAARAAARAWRRGALAHAFDVAMPERPARPEAAGAAAREPHAQARQGRLGAQPDRDAARARPYRVRRDRPRLRHGRAVRRRACRARSSTTGSAVGADEAMHFALLDRRLRALGSRYGALPAHDGLWEAAAATAHDLLARLAVVPMVLEARGLDVTPATVAAFERGRRRALGRDPEAHLPRRNPPRRGRHALVQGRLRIPRHRRRPRTGRR